ncbi:hypothetical protein [Lacisediminihabitans sp.]|uniref:hypothetical protein n=1 Tax=Lacisediminihabitans sp. TaxID=2787631 RepID=UPI00374DE2A3
MADSGLFESVKPLRVEQQNLAESLADAALLTADGWNAVATHRDLLGRDRATTALR